ncbi:MAG: hypothetical protein HY073_02035, partial [Deltaproteobacteria bacterium]|nr:hypothetical protein [Deltaproteobacteria bacterium]
LLQAKLEKEEEKKKGYETGREEGLLTLSEKILEVGQAKEKIFQEAEPQIIQMVMEIAEKVIGRALKKGAIVDVVKSTMAQAVGQKVVVRVHPSDLEVLKEKESDLLMALNQNQTLAVKGDESITAGGCIIETEAGVVDARLEVQLKAIRKALGLGAPLI